MINKWVSILFSLGIKFYVSTFYLIHVEVLHWKSGIVEVSALCGRTRFALLQFLFDFSSVIFFIDGPAVKTFRPANYTTLAASTIGKPLRSQLLERRSGRWKSLLLPPPLRMQISTSPVYLFSDGSGMGLGCFDLACSLDMVSVLVGVTSAVGTMLHWINCRCSSTTLMIHQSVAPGSIHLSCLVCH